MRPHDILIVYHTDESIRMFMYCFDPDDARTHADVLRAHGTVAGTELTADEEQACATVQLLVARPEELDKDVFDSMVADLALVADPNGERNIAHLAGLAKPFDQNQPVLFSGLVVSVGMAM